MEIKFIQCYLGIVKFIRCHCVLFMSKCWGEQKKYTCEDSWRFGHKRFKLIMLLHTKSVLFQIHNLHTPKMYSVCVSLCQMYGVSLSDHLSQQIGNFSHIIIRLTSISYSIFFIYLKKIFVKVLRIDAAVTKRMATPQSICCYYVFCGTVVKFATYVFGSYLQS